MKNRIAAKLFGIAAIFALSGCDLVLGDGQKRLERHIATSKVGSSNDVWLELLNSFGEWERVGLITGYWDDYAACSDIATLLEGEFRRSYRCVPAN